MADAELMDKIERIEVARLLPGDLLVLTTRDGVRLSEHAVTQIRQALQERLPAWVKVVVLEGFDLQVIRPDGE